MKSILYKGYTVYENGKVMGLKGRFLKPGTTSAGYPSICICYGGKKQTILMHRLIAILFIDNPDNKPQVNHINSNRLDFSISNLEWTTQKENMRHCFDNNNAKKTIDSITKRMSKWVIDLSIGIFYSSCKEASISIGINENTLRSKLSGFRLNNTNLIYA